MDENTSGKQNQMKIWTKIKSSDALQKALNQARGIYQRHFLEGIENLSGSTLRGKARRYGLRYKISRQNLLARLTKNNIPWREEKGENRRRILILG